MREIFKQAPIRQTSAKILIYLQEQGAILKFPFWFALAWTIVLVENLAISAQWKPNTASANHSHRCT